MKRQTACVVLKSDKAGDIEQQINDQIDLGFYLFSFSMSSEDGKTIFIAVMVRET